MKAIRRSLKGDRDSKPHHVSITPKSAIAILPPKKVIKALYDYEPDAGNIQELAFNKGDFFHVLSREDDPDWYEACNPLVPNARGLVPVSFFEVVHKNEKDRHSGGSKDSLTQDLYDSGFSERSVHNDRRDSTNTNKQAALRMSAIGKGSGAMVYGIVQYDFHAERPDELEAKAGEAIIVIAQSNPEWFVAKPIRRLGGPGLIPVSFIEIKDMRTGETVADPLDAVRRAGVPRVEEWKKMTAEYKNSSISLGKLESSGASGMQSVSNGMEKMSMSSNGGGYRPQVGNELGYQSRSESRVGTYSQSGHPQQQYYPQPMQPDPNYRVAPVSASIPRYCFDNDKYWYVIEAKMEDGTIWELSRYYHDFYDFQIALLSQFEEEAGNGGRTRTLPYMPGPVTHVTDAISNGRRQNLDDYIKKLLAMPPHISRCPLVCQLFTPRPGDFEIDPNAIGDPYRLSNESQQSSGHNVSMSDSRQSSQAHMSASAAAVYPSANGPSARAPHQRQQSSLSQQNSAASQSRTELQPPAMNRQASSLTQTSNASSTNAITVKVTFEDDTIAFLVPSDINFNQLLEKLRDRLKVTGNIQVNYRENLSRKDEGTPMTSDQNLDEALRLNPKLSLVVKRIK